MKRLEIDIETYSDIDLSKAGVYKYAESDDFDILLFAYSVDGSEVSVIDFTAGEELPDDILSALTDDSITKWAHNSQFERVCISAWLHKHHPGMITEKYLSPDGWKCSMVWAAYMGLPLSLDAVGRVLKLENQKMKEGRDLVRYFCTPCKPTKANGERTRNLPEHAPDKWELFKAYTNSSMVVYKKLSPNHSGKRTHSIDRISPHCVVGQCTAEGLGDWFARSSTQASSNYGIDKNGRVGLYVEEKNRSWCTSSNANDQRAVTIECASDTKEPYAMNSAVYNTLVKLCTDICKRNGKKKLLWLGDKAKTLNYSPKSDEMIITVHRWFANKSCPGNWLYARLGDLAKQVTKNLGGTTTTTTAKTGLQAASLKNLSEADVIKKVGSLFTADMKKSGILASVSLAQFILESGYGKSELAQKANNVFGMKKSLSGNTWAGSTWDGKSVYTKKTQEDDGTGKHYTITADFRKYKDVETSIADHSAYLNGAKNGSKLRYAGLKGCKDYKKAVQIIKDGGYATSTTYVKNLCSIIEKWNLTKYDTATTTTTSSTSKSKVPYLVRVSITDLNIRKGPGTNYARTGKFTGIGTFTIVEEKTGQGSKTGWGKLKSGAGWISLDYAKKV